ncbi:SSURE domain-containing protein [Streptococcus respiraculi]|uniref:SSURE domain-containing protein n=1 Tax=Streptococcus respiraculi TaxID=2021971 RepID=UPI000E771462|nr:fibronectin-binding SSURE repeat-containing protein [Streptococcus respiraculi]
MANRERYTVFSIRKFKAGVASVLIASGLVIFLGHQTVAQADELLAPQAEAVVSPVNEKTDELIPTTEEQENAADVEKQVAEAETAIQTEAVKKEAESIPAGSGFRAANETTADEEKQADEVKQAVEENINANTEIPASYLEKANADGTGPFLAGVNGIIPFEAFGGDGMLTRALLKEAKDAPWSDNGSDKNEAIPPLKNLSKNSYFYKVALDGEAAGKTGKDLLDILKKTGTNTYGATVNVFGNKNGKADEDNVVATRKVTVKINGLTAVEDVKKAVKENIKAETTLPAAYLEKANADGSGPFLAGVNGTIPFEAFGGDGMLTRLLLKASENAPWSDNGSAMNPALQALESLTNGQYFYQVALDGEAAGKTGKDLLDALKKAGTNTYTATVNVFGNKNGKADEDNVVATRKVKVTINGLTAATDVKKAVEENIKADTEIPAAYLEKANADGSGPFLAGVNGVIPFEAFGGDGMLTRALLKESDKAPWSDNGSAKHPALPPLKNLSKNSYFYKVALDGEAAGKTGKDLLDILKKTGTNTYTATVNVFGNKNGKADEDNVVATRKVKVTINGLTAVEDVKKAVEGNIKEETTVPAAYLEKANADGTGPFLAGVNGTIPFEFFGGDGMLTRLLLKASETAPWSDNGSAMNPALQALESLTNGQYFYQVALDGPATGKTGQELLNALKAAGTHTYTATVKVFGNKDGKADESNVVATRQVSLSIFGFGGSTRKIEKQTEQNQLPTAPAMPNNMVQNSQTPMQENMKAQVDQAHPMTNMKQNTAAMMDDKMMKKELPQTGSESSATLTLIGMALASFAGFALRKKSENE